MFTAPQTPRIRVCATPVSMHTAGRSNKFMHRRPDRTHMLSAILGATLLAIAVYASPVIAGLTAIALLSALLI
jgi:hypothetical protein